MKKYSYIGVSLIILIFGIIFIPKIIDRISNNEVVTADRLNKNTITSGEKSDASEAEVGYIEIDGKKKRAPEFQFVNQHGDTITDEDYKGKVYVVEFFFTTCPSICPIMSKNLVEVQKEFKDEDDFGIASFSIDPNHDTPEVLNEYAKEYGITHPNWNLMTGDKEKIYDLANNKFGLYAGENDQIPGGFAHQGLFVLIDQDGYIRSRKDEFGNPIIYYRGSIPRNKSVVEGEETPQIDILIQDLKTLL